MTRTVKLATIGLVLMAACGSAFAQQEQAPAGSPPAVQSDVGRGLGVLGACIGAGLAVVGGAIGIARIGGNTVEAIARQPEAAGAMTIPMIVTASMIEGATLFAVVVGYMGVGKF